MNENYLTLRLENGSLFESNINPPPAEKKNNVIQFELTTGCSYNSCTFCDMYSTEKFRQKSIEEFKQHVDYVWAAVKKTEFSEIEKLERVFIGSGNSLSIDKQVLNASIQYVAKKFKQNTGFVANRIAIYGNTIDILKQGSSNLEYLNCGGTCGQCSVDEVGSKSGLGLIYWGVESGSDDVLKFINKGSTRKDIIAARKMISKTEIETSVTIMLGLGGIKYFNNHLKDTIDILNNIEPRFLTFIGLNASTQTKYSKQMSESIKTGENRPLTEIEMSDQLIEFVKGLRIRTTVGCFDETIQTVGFNPIHFGSVRNMDYYERQNLVNSLEQKKKNLVAQSSKNNHKQDSNIFLLQ